jgi:hypothetical protein
MAAQILPGDGNRYQQPSRVRIHRVIGVQRLASQGARLIFIDSAGHGGVTVEDEGAHTHVRARLRNSGEMEDVAALQRDVAKVSGRPNCLADGEGL